MTDETISRLPLLPLRELVPFPRMVLPVQVGRPSSVAAVSAALRADGRMVIAAQRDAAQDELTGLADMHSVGVIGRITRASSSEGPVGLLIQCIERVALAEIEMTNDHWQATVSPRPDAPPSLSGVSYDALVGAVRSTLSEYFSLNPEMASISLLAAGQSDPQAMTDLVSVLPDIPVAVRQAMLEADDQVERLRLAQAELVRLSEVLRIQGQIVTDTKRELDRMSRNAILQEQMRAIQRELGKDDPKASENAALRARFERDGMPEAVRTRGLAEIDRLESIPTMSPEVSIIRNYIDWLVELPWGTYSEDNLDLRRAAQVLDEDHWGLEKPKQRILEYLAVRRLAPAVKSPILCLVGPPGVGKTSLGQSIARAMDRRFLRLSLGGMHDEAEIRGHRRTYIGALPGRILQQLKAGGTANPVFMLDELDKIDHGVRGDPAAALLEVLDPEQNHAFTDNYLEVPFDLSRVMFVATANLLETVPGPLRDRLEVISLPGYTATEKEAIARRYLVPKQLTNNGLADKGVSIDDATLDLVIGEYTREAGVRNLERELGSIMRKIARRVAEGDQPPAIISAADVPAYLGAPRFEPGELESADSRGVATGLVVTEAGGDVVAVEAMVMPTKDGLILTGQLGDVMKESARAGLSWVESNGEAYGIAPNLLGERSIHIHVPAGAVPKDGPSAGVTMVAAMVSALSGRLIRRDVAMTGEITLRGSVLPVGGIKAKLLAAQRAGARTVVIPKRNEKDLLEEVSAEVRDSMDIRLVSTIEEALAIVLAPVQEVAGDQVAADQLVGLATFPSAIA